MRDLPAWVADYVGLPFRALGRDRTGLDCWGLVRLVLAERFDVHAPAWDGRGYDPARSCWDRPAVAALMQAEAEVWQALAAGAERPGDVLLLFSGRHPCHVGIVVATRAMLHIEDGLDAVVVDPAGPSWRGRIAGRYRHRDLVP